MGHIPLILKTGIFWKEIFLPFLMRHAELWVVPQLGQLRVDLLLVRTGCDVRVTQIVLGLDERLRLLGVGILHPTVGIRNLWKEAVCKTDILIATLCVTKLDHFKPKLLQIVKTICDDVMQWDLSSNDNQANYHEWYRWDLNGGHFQ